jgi:putative hydrolase of the HAD superfamily
MTKISFIYFDVGGVLVHDLSGRKIIKDLGLNFLQAIQIDRLYDHYEPAFCRGEYTDQQIKELIEEKLKIRLDPKLSVVELLVSYFEANRTLYPLLESLQGNYQVGLLTNMNIGMLDIIRKRGLLPTTSWDIIIDSSIVGMAKPERGIYELAQVKANVPADEILFIDNLKANLEFPKKLGWQTFWYDQHNFARSTRLLTEFLGLKP